METMPFIRLRRQMGENSEYNPICNLYMSVADLKNYRLAYMWGSTMGPVTKRPGPEFNLIHIPEEHHINQQALMLPDHDLTLVMGSDYMGEDKKGFLRNAMYRAGDLNMLGLHAGHTPKFVKRYAQVGEQMREAFREYVKEVKDGSFPAEENTYK